jgi:20S proteasome subunit beta 6
MTLVLLLLILFSSTAHGSFEPYQLNGGLVAAVAGKDFVVIATDTRLTSGYNILQRDHISSRLWGVETESTKTPPVYIASAGCNADCEALKRTVRSDLRRANYFGECANPVKPSQVATLLGQILYSRRGFPFYSFCVLAGLDENGCGQVYGYDAIGSYEQLQAVASGTGKELLQPILDRLYSNTSTQVAGTSQEVVETLVDAYRAVSEREIGVGDSIVCYVVQRTANEQFERQVLKFPLKKH